MTARASGLRRGARLAAVVVAAATASGCDGGSGNAVDLEFTRADGSTATFPETMHAWCASFDEDNPEVDAVHVLAGKPWQRKPAEAFWSVSAVRADVEADPATTLPNNFVYTEPRGASLFAVDDVEHRNNQLSSAAEESAGTIRVELSGCETGDDVRLIFEEVTIGSEYSDLPTMSVDGTVDAAIGGPP